MRHPLKLHARTRWRRIIPALVLGYTAYFWLFPIVLAIFISALPYLHSYSIRERFFASLAGTLISMGLLCLVYRSSRSALKANPLGVLSGALMFTFGAAWLSGNSMAPLVAALPNEPFERTMIVVAATHGGTKFRVTDLTLKDVSSGSIYHLTLSRRLFGETSFKTSDSILLRGKTNLFGTYISAVSANNSFKPKPLRGSA